jgi:hypothetical protein
MSPNRRDLLRVVAVLAAAWVLVVLVLARWQRSAKLGPAAAEPRLVHYPGYEGVEEQTTENLSFRKYWFTLNEDYPSKSVYHFYKNLLEPEGWQPAFRGEPQWTRRIAKDEARDILHALWISPDRLFQLEVEMMSVAKLVTADGTVIAEEREPGIQVFVTQQRALHPGIIFQPRTREPGRGVGHPGL